MMMLIHDFALETLNKNLQIFMRKQEKKKLLIE